MADPRFITYQDVSSLHQIMREPVTALLLALKKEAKMRRTFPTFAIFEGYRSPERQDYLITQGTTKAKAWQSAHQFGLAVDLVPFDGQKFSWDTLEENWILMRAIARQHGLETPIKWDKPHVQHPQFERMKTVIRSV